MAAMDEPLAARRLLSSALACPRALPSSCFVLSYRGCDGGECPRGVEADVFVLIVVPQRLSLCLASATTPRRLDGQRHVDVCVGETRRQRTTSRVDACGLVVAELSIRRYKTGSCRTATLRTFGTG